MSYSVKLYATDKTVRNENLTKPDFIEIASQIEAGNMISKSSLLFMAAHEMESAGKVAERIELYRDGKLIVSFPIAASDREWRP